MHCNYGCIRTCSLQSVINRVLALGARQGPGDGQRRGEAGDDGGEDVTPGGVADNHYLTDLGHVAESFEGVGRDGLAAEWEVLLWDGGAHALAYPTCKEDDGDAGKGWGDGAWDTVGGGGGAAGGDATGFGGLVGAENGGGPGAAAIVASVALSETGCHRGRPENRTRVQ